MLFECYSCLLGQITITGAAEKMEFAMEIRSSLLKKTWHVNMSGWLKAQFQIVCMFDKLAGEGKGFLKKYITVSP